MDKFYDIEIAFEFEPFKVLFEEVFYKKINTTLNFKVNIVYSEKENNYKDLVYASKWMSIEFNNTFFEKDFPQNHLAFSNLIFGFFNYVFSNFKGVDFKHLLKILFNLKDEVLIFLFSEVSNYNVFKNAFSQAINKIEQYKTDDPEIVKQITKSFKQKSKKIYLEYKNDIWVVLNLLFNAGKYHHDEIAKNINDKRIAKPDILINEENLIDTIKYKALWKVKARKRTFVRIKPNDIALYSNIAMSNLKKAKEIYDDKDSILWKYIQMPEDEKKLMDYYELVITAVILAFSSIEALINIAIPKGYFHKRRERNEKTGRLITNKYSKDYIERWYTMNDKMNIVLPEALNIPLPNQQKWYSNLTKLEDRRNKIVHVVDKKSNERYSELLEKEIFSIIESHIHVIKFFGKWATDNQDYLLNDLPYGIGYDDIMPSLISDKDYYEVSRERRGIK